MYQFYVNNELYQVEGNGKLLPFLRDVCKCKSVKDGCSEGACGTCHVLVDGVDGWKIDPYGRRFF